MHYSFDLPFKCVVLFWGNAAALQGRWVGSDLIGAVNIWRIASLAGFSYPPESRAMGRLPSSFTFAGIFRPMVALVRWLSLILWLAGRFEATV